MTVDNEIKKFVEEHHGEVHSRNKKRHVALEGCKLLWRKRINYDRWYVRSESSSRSHIPWCVTLKLEKSDYFYDLFRLGEDTIEKFLSLLQPGSSGNRILFAVDSQTWCKGHCKWIALYHPEKPGLDSPPSATHDAAR